jgi:hypothetical protein
MISVSKFCNKFLQTKPDLLAHYSPINSSLLLLVRSISAIYLSAFYIYDISTLSSAIQKIIFLTDVSFFLLTWLYFIIILQ